MILKTLSRKSNTGQLVRYVLRYVFKEKVKAPGKNKNAIIDSAFIIRHNIRSKTMEGMIHELNETEKYRWARRKNNVKLFHNIISFSSKDKDKITDEMLRDIAERFIAERNPNCVYIGTKHEEGVDHIHLHIIQSPVEISGRNASISKRKFLSIRKSLQLYQSMKYPELIHSLPNLNPETTLTKETILQRVKAARQTNKEFLIETLEGLYASAQSKEEYLKQLEAAGCKAYYRGNKLQGIHYDGLKYRFSKLGMTEELLNGLDQKLQLNTALAELKALRTGREKEKKQIQAKITEVPQIQSRAFDDIATIRNRSDKEHEILNGEQERVMNIPSNFAPFTVLTKLPTGVCDEQGIKGYGGK